VYTVKCVKNTQVNFFKNPGDIFESSLVFPESPTSNGHDKARIQQQAQQ